MAVETNHKDVTALQAEYDRLYNEAPIRDEDRAYAWIAKQLHKIIPKAGSILDVACGGGYFLRELQRLYGASVRFNGVDLSNEALAIACKEFPAATYSLSVAEDMPFEPRSFDAITCLGSLEHFLNIAQALTEIKRVLRPNGIFLVMVPNIMWYQDILSVLFTKNRKSRNQTHELFASHGEWKEMLESSGFNVVKTLKYNGIAKSGWKQILKNILIPERFSYHFIYIAKPRD
ncbi:MAG: methyltransferase domain-containing protein [Candidatus Omnitrophota bacterium]